MPGKALLQRAWNYLVWSPKQSLGFPAIISSRAGNLEDPNTPINATTIDELYGITKTSSGQSVNEKTALNNSAVWRCADIISGLIASLPVKPYITTGEGRNELKNHFVYPLITMRPSKYYSKVTYLKRAIMHYLFWGNHVATIQRRRGAPNIVEGFNLIHPRYYKEITEDSRGSLIYVFDVKGKTKKVKADDILHVPNLGDDGWGKGVITHAREDIGLDFATLKYGGKWFDSGGHLHEYISTDQTPNPDKLDEMREFYKKIKKEGGPQIMTGGMNDYQ